jgi:CheY-like chemotaxis protein
VESPVLEPAKRVLVVEDTHDIRELLVDLLESEGYVVTAATDGLQGLECLQAGVFDVVLLDLMMPVMNGLQLLESLPRQVECAPPIIAMSAFERFHEEARSLGAAAFIGKPVDVDHLLQSIARHAGRDVDGPPPVDLL